MSLSSEELELIFISLCNSHDDVTNPEVKMALAELVFRVKNELIERSRIK